MRKILVVAFILGLASPLAAEPDAAIPFPPGTTDVYVDAGTPPLIVVTPTKPSDKLHDPISEPAAAFDDLKAAKKQGWAAAILCALVLFTTAFARASTRWPSSKLFAWFAKRKTAIFVIGGAGTVAAAAFNVLALGGEWTAVMWAGAGAALALIAPKHAPPAEVK